MNKDLDWIMRFLYSSRESLIVSKPLIKKLGLHSAIVLCDLLHTYERYSTTRTSMLDSDGSFYYTIPLMQENTGLKRRQQENAFIKLKTNKLVYIDTYSKDGSTNIVDQRRWFKLDLIEIKNYMCNL